MIACQPSEHAQPSALDSDKKDCKPYIDPPESRPPNLVNDAAMLNIDRFPGEKFPVISSVLHACQVLKSAPTGLGHFIRKSLNPDKACTVD